MAPLPQLHGFATRNCSFRLSYASRLEQRRSTGTCRSRALSNSAYPAITMAASDGLLYLPSFLAPAPHLATRHVVRRSATRHRGNHLCRSASSNVSRIRACSTPPKQRSGKDELHESWDLYSRDDCCVVCLGRGESGCLYCFGDGVVSIGPDEHRDSIMCPQCNGSKICECARCSGTGKRPLTRYDVLLGKEVRNVTNAELRAPITPKYPPL